MNEDRRSATERVVRLMLEHRTELFAYIRAIVRDHVLTEDIYQDVMVVAIEKAPELPAGASFGGWVREVARRTALNALKSQRRRPGAMDPALLDVLEPVWGSREGNWNSDARDALRRCIEQLSEKARRILHDRYEAGHSGKVLAEHLGLTVNSAYATLTRVHRALESCMRRRLAL